MVRTADGRTIVTVHVTGLDASITYAAHVHKQACANGEAGRPLPVRPVGTAVNDANEIWPGFTTNAAGIGNGYTIARRVGRPGAPSPSWSMPHGGDQDRLRRPPVR